MCMCVCVSQPPELLMTSNVMWHNMNKLRTVYHESFEAEKFCGKLYMLTFAKKLSRNSSYFLLNPYMNSAILNFQVSPTCKKAQNPRNFSSLKLSWYTVYVSCSQFH